MHYNSTIFLSFRRMQSVFAITKAYHINRMRFLSSTHRPIPEICITSVQCYFFKKFRIEWNIIQVRFPISLSEQIYTFYEWVRFVQQPKWNIGHWQRFRFCICFFFYRCFCINMGVFTTDRQIFFIKIVCKMCSVMCDAIERAKRKETQRENE